MSLQTLVVLGDLCPTLLRGVWSLSDIQSMGKVAPAVTGGERNESLLAADLAANDAMWRILSLVDPVKIGVPDKYLFTSIFSDVRNLLLDEYKIIPDEADPIATKLSRFLAQLTVRLRSQKRAPIPKSVKVAMIDSVTSVRCWYCGSSFADSDIDSFLSGSQKQKNVPPFIDFVTHRGQKPRDLQIEVDHIVPVVRGGDMAPENLRLACGWCNRFKRQLASIYDANAMPQLYRHPRRGEWLLPERYWVIRTVATRRRCEWPSGCPTYLEEAPLFVAPVRGAGAMVPGNLGVYCRIHDPLGDIRLVPNHDD